MPIYDMYPYSNLHELNLDFIIKLCEEFKDGVEGFEQEITDLGTRLEGEIDALEDRIEPFEQMFTLQTVGGETQIRANYRMYAGHGLTASSLKVNGALELEQPFTINLTGDVEGTASTNNLLNPLNIETTVVNGGGGGSQEDVYFDGDVVFYQNSPNSTANITVPVGQLKNARLYTVIFDDQEYNHLLTHVKDGEPYIEDNYTDLPFALASFEINVPELLPEGTIKHLKVVRENYDLYYDNDPTPTLNQITHPDYGNIYVGMLDDGLPLELKEGDYIVVIDNTQFKNLQAVRDTATSSIAIGDQDLTDGVFVSETLSGGRIDYRGYQVVFTTPPSSNLKIFGPKQTGVLRSVQLFSANRTGASLVFPNEIVAGSTLVIDNTDYSFIDSNECTFCHQGKTFIGSSVPGTMAGILEMDDQIGLLALFAAPNITESAMTINVLDFVLYYTNCEYDDIFHASGSSE